MVQQTELFIKCNIARHVYEGARAAVEQYWVLGAYKMLNYETFSLLHSQSDACAQSVRRDLSYDFSRSTYDPYDCPLEIRVERS